VFNNTVKILRDVFKIGIESGARMTKPPFQSNVLA
jgi:hypothetical protein